MAQVTLGYIQSYPYLYPSKTHTRITGTGFQRVRVKGFIKIYINILLLNNNDNRNIKMNAHHNLR